METVAEIRITKRKLKSLVNDTVKSAEAINLVYTSDVQPGITRVKKGKNFIYKYDGKTVTDPETLQRIRSLVLPPAWADVWICAAANGHLQATGLDARNRKQYKYHTLWNTLRNHTKFFNLLEFGKTLPAVRTKLKEDLSLSGLPQERVLAAAVSLMQCTCMRVGSNTYEKMNGSYGLTTLKDKHVEIKGAQMKFCFKGKKGVYHNISFKSKKLAHIVQACKDIPGKELFQYYDTYGDRKAIDSGMVNEYIRTISEGSFTAKDFRTWAGTLEAIRAFRELGTCQTATEAKKKVVEALDMVAKQLGNTRAVCKKYYVHPAVIDLYSNNSLEKYFKQADVDNCDPNETDLNAEEKILMKILEAYGSAVTL